jgi:hypothetical protein
MSLARIALLEAVEGRLLPFLRKDGFVPATGSSKPDPSQEWRAAFPFGQLRRVIDTETQALEIQLDKRGAARFVLNFGVVSRRGGMAPLELFVA